MEGFNPDWVGSAAAFFTTASFMPQALKVLRTRDTKAISLGMYSMMTFGVFLWLIYGILLEKQPMIYANAITLALACVILFQKIRLG